MLRLNVTLALFLSTLVACGGDSTGPQRGLSAGTYRVSFDVPFYTTIAGNLVGEHEFEFSVTNPSDADSFQLNSSSRTLTQTETNFLDPDPRGVIAGASQWRIQWYVSGSTASALRVTMAEAGGGFDLPEGCQAVRNESRVWPGTNCRVERVR